MPIDPESDGTWIAVNNALVFAALLNVNPIRTDRGAMARPPRSRGVIVPLMMQFGTARDVKCAICDLDPHEFAPFRVVVVDWQSVFEIRSDGDGIDVTEVAVTNRPLMFTSSGLGDALVESPRRALFDGWFDGNDSERQIEHQDAFHRHMWPDRPELSVCMSRPDARTVSYTVVDIESDRATMAYYSDAPDRPVAPVGLTLDAIPLT